MSLLPLTAGTTAIVWTVTPQGPPAVVRRCPRCDVARPFVSTSRFRINGNGRRLDVWLIWSCSVCDATWNLRLHRRVLASELGTERLSRLHDNDPAAALAAAFDRAALAGAQVRTEPIDWHLEGDRPRGPAVVTIHAPYGGPRLDRLLAEGLGLSRSAVSCLARDGGLRLAPEDLRALRRPVRDGQRVEVCEAGQSSK